MTKLRILYVLVFCCSVFFACKDKEDQKLDIPVVTPPPSGKSTQELLSDTTWKITALTSTGIGDVWNNALLVKPCNKDNTYFFKTNNILTTYDTPMKCSVTDPDSTSGPYILMANNKKIYLELLLGTIQIKDTTDIQSIDENTMILNIEYSGLPGVITFKH